MLHKGPVPHFVHGLVEYAAAALLIAAPFLLDFESSAATAVSIVVGVALLVVAASTEGRSGLVDAIPVRIHVVLDLVVAALLIAAPFLFGFSDERNATAFFIVLGVVHVLLTIATRFLPAGDAQRTATRTR